MHRRSEDAGKDAGMFNRRMCIGFRDIYTVQGFSKSAGMFDVEGYS